MNFTVSLLKALLGAVETKPVLVVGSPGFVLTAQYGVIKKVTSRNKELILECAFYDKPGQHKTYNAASLLAQISAIPNTHTVTVLAVVHKDSLDTEPHKGLINGLTLTANRIHLNLKSNSY